jgi:exoribonuclease-2
MEKGTLIEFRLHGERQLAVADRPEGKKNWVVTDSRGQSHVIHPRQVTYEVLGQIYQISDIPAFLHEVQAHSDSSALELAWELLVEEGSAIAPADLAQLLFSQQTPVQVYVAYTLLSEDKLYFKQKGDRYEPRSTTQVAELKHQLEVEQQRQHEWQALLSTLTARLAESTEQRQSGTPSTQAFLQAIAQFRQRIELLERFATLGDEASHSAPVLEILSALRYPQSATAAFHLLVDLGLWTVHENLFLRRAQIPVNFSHKVLEVAKSRLQSLIPDPDRQRLDLTNLKVYTIDDASTSEIDDGVSLEYGQDGEQRLWIHIADPTRWLTPGDELDLEARRRCTTIYLPTGMISMFPHELATGPMSLVQGQVCCALSFGIVLDQAGAVQDYTIHSSLIKPTYRLTYEDVDEMLELRIQAEEELAAISAWAKQRYLWRQSQGAISIQMPEASIKVDNDEITIDVLDNSLSRQLVAEMMILAGEVAGHYGQSHNLALPFRNQPQPELPPPDELWQLPAGPVRSCAIRRCMPRSEISLQPSGHASLGLNSYIQVTSPIRRYSDLLAHFQIKANLRGEVPPFSVDQMQELIQEVATVAQESALVERQTNRYWGLEYLRRHPQQVWQVLMLRWLREQDNLGLILIEDLGLELAMRFSRAVTPGDTLYVRVSYVDPRQDIIQFEETSLQEISTAL